MGELSPISITPSVTSVPTLGQRTMNLSGTPMPEDIRSMVLKHFDMENANEEELEIVYQYILHKSPSAENDDVRLTIESLVDKLAPNKQELFMKIRDMAKNELQLSNPNEMVSQKRDIINKEIPALEKQAIETQDWRFYLRAVRERDKLNESSDIIG